MQPVPGPPADFGHHGDVPRRGRRMQWLLPKRLEDFGLLLAQAVEMNFGSRGKTALQQPVQKNDRQVAFQYQAVRVDFDRFGRHAPEGASESTPSPAGAQRVQVPVQLDRPMALWPGLDNRNQSGRRGGRAVSGHRDCIGCSHCVWCLGGDNSSLFSVAPARLPATGYFPPLAFGPEVSQLGG